jgi:hypothetical protein
MAGTVGKLDSVFVDVLPKKRSGEAQYVTMASPNLESSEENFPKPLIRFGVPNHCELEPACRVAETP